MKMRIEKASESFFSCFILLGVMSQKPLKFSTPIVPPIGVWVLGVFLTMALLRDLVPCVRGVENLRGFWLIRHLWRCV